MQKILEARIFGKSIVCILRSPGHQRRLQIISSDSIPFSVSSVSFLADNYEYYNVCDSDHL